jgi:cell division protein ZapA
MIDARVTALGGLGGQSETRMLLFAALTLADEVHEQRKPVENDTPDGDGDADADALAERLVGFAETLENLAGWLEAETNDA